MGLARLDFSAAILFCAIGLASCAEKFPQDIPESYTVPNEYTFSVPYEKAWPEVVKTISAETRVRTMDKEAGIIVTEVAVVDNKPSATPEKASTFGRTYKNSYSVKLSEAGPGQTTVKVRTNLTEEYFAIYNRECPAESFAAFLRQDLFRKICGNLYRNPARCLALFPTYNAAVCLPPAPRPTLTQEEEVSHPDLDPMWKLEINIKELQQALARAGYDPGPVDGRMGKKTRAALIHFQKDNKLEPTGKLNESTMIALEI